MTSDTLAQNARAAHDLGLASWLGGSAFGQVALNPAVRKVSDKGERGQVVNSAWGAYNVINMLSLAAVAIGWFGARLTESAPPQLTDREKQLAKAKDTLTLAAVATGVASAVQGARLASEATDGAVSIEGGTKPAPETPRSAARAQRGLQVSGPLNIVSGIGLVVVNALLAQAAHSRPPLRRGLRRKSR